MSDHSRIRHVQSHADQAPSAGETQESAILPEEAPEFEEQAFEELFPGETEIPEYVSRQARKKRRRRVVIVAVLALMAALFAGAAIYLHSLSANPASYFETAQPASSAVIIAEVTPAPAAAVLPEATPTPTPDPLSELTAAADASLMQNTVNILLIGADYAEERETWSGKNGLTSAHADVMIVLAVNFDANTASLISLPRDTYTTIPGVDGIYKLNASLDCGGGITAENGAGFLKVCEAASHMLGGIPVDYYYAVTMPAVKQLVDAVGGVDYDLETDFSMQGRSYKAGQQHMDGQAVLDYLRVRKSRNGLGGGDTGDVNRVNRQKKMLVAIFDKIKSAGLLTSIPSLLSSFSGQLYTNCTTSQTAALALCGYNMPTENIRMYSMSGSMRTLYGWSFCFTDQSNRKDILKTVYGVDASTMREQTLEYALFVYNEKLAEQYLSTCAGLGGYVRSVLDADALSPDVVTDEYGNPIVQDPIYQDPIYQEPVYEEPVYEDPDDPAVIAYRGGGMGGAVLAKSVPVFTAASAPRLFGAPRYGIYTDFERALYTNYISAYNDLETTLESSRKQAEKYIAGDVGSMDGMGSALASATAALKSAAEQCVATFGYSSTLSFGIPALANTNEIYVDFR